MALAAFLQEISLVREGTFRKIKPLGKKGLAEDFFDFVFAVTVAFFILFFVGFALQGGVYSANKLSLNKVSHFEFISSAINNLRVEEMGSGGLDPKTIEQKISESRTLGGKTITLCQDYFVKEDCNQDVVGLTKNTPGTICKWEDSTNACQFHDLKLEQAASTTH